MPTSWYASGSRSPAGRESGPPVSSSSQSPSFPTRPPSSTPTSPSLPTSPPVPSFATSSALFRSSGPPKSGPERKHPRSPSSPLRPLPARTLSPPLPARTEPVRRDLMAPPPPGSRAEREPHPRSRGAAAGPGTVKSSSSGSREGASAGGGAHPEGTTKSGIFSSLFGGRGHKTAPATSSPTFSPPSSSASSIASARPPRAAVERSDSSTSSTFSAVSSNARTASSSRGPSGLSHVRSPSTQAALAQEHLADQVRRLEAVDSHHLLSALLDGAEKEKVMAAGPSGRWNEPGKLELYASVFASRAGKAASFEDLFPALPAKSPTAQTTTPTSPKSPAHTLPTPPSMSPHSSSSTVHPAVTTPTETTETESSTFVAESPMRPPSPPPDFDLKTGFIESMLTITAIFTDRTSPLPIRLAGFKLLATFLRTSKELLPVRSIASVQLSMVLGSIVSRSAEDGLEDMAPRLECMRLLVAGAGKDGEEGKSGWNWDGWADWARVVRSLQSWVEELETAWKAEEASKEHLTEMSSPTHGPEDSQLPTLLSSLSVFELVVTTQTSFFSASDRSAILPVFARLAWHGLEITCAQAGTPVVAEEDMVQTRRGSDTSAAPTMLSSLGLESGKAAFSGSARGRSGFWPPSVTPSIASVSRSPSLSRKAQATVSTSTSAFGSPVATGRAGSALSTPARPFASMLGQISQNPSFLFPAPTATNKPLETLHPLCGTFLGLFSNLARHALAPSEIIGPAARLMFAMLNAGGETKDKAWEVVLALFGKGSAAKFNLVLEQVLAGTGTTDKDVSLRWGEGEDDEVTVVRGAVVCIRLTLHQAYSYRRSAQDLSTSVSSLATQSMLTTVKDIESLRLTEFYKQLCSAMAKTRCKTDDDREGWVWVDMEVLKVIEEVLEDSKDSGMDSVLGEGDVVVEVLHEAVGWVQSFRYPDGRCFQLQRQMDLELDPVRPDTPPILQLYGELNRTIPRRLATYFKNKGNAAMIRIPVCQADLLLDLGGHLSESVALLVIETYKSVDLCIPSNADWIANLNRVVRAFYDSPIGVPVSDYPEVRRKIAELLFEHVYERVKLDPEQRPELVYEIILPLLEKTLERERHEDVERLAWKALLEAAVLETLEMDDDEIANVTGPNGESLRCFERIRTLLKKIACAPGCSSNFQSQLERRLAQMGSPNALSPVQGLQSPSTLDADLPPLALQTAAFFDETMSPKSPPMGLPAGFMPGSRRGSATPTPIPTPSRASTSTPMAEQSDQHTHERCKSIGACQTLIAIFSRLTFRPLRSDSDNRRQGVSIASKRSLALFHDVLGLLRPHHGGSGSNTARKMSVDELQSPLLHASCPRARLTLLQWLVRLRADTQHRVWVTSTVDTSYAAPILGRGSRDAAVPGSSSRPVATDQPERQGRSAKVAPIAETEERRRSGSRRREPSRPGRREASTARGRMPEQGSSRAVVEQPMWYNGDPVGFEAPQDTTPSSSMFTFDPQIVLTQPHDVSRFSNGVWLPVSDYLEVVVELLTDERADYELVSFLLCYLPVQLVNQHFFCGPRSTQELQVLLNHLAMWLGPSGQLPITRRLPATPGLRKSDVHAVAYQTLDVLVSYYRQFNSAHHRLLVRAFTTGISASDYMGKACIQALTMMATMAIPGPSKDTALAELRMAVTKDLPDIMEKLGKLTSNVSLAIHILEFVYAVSQNRDLYANFTSDQYRLPFAVALNIIRIHHESVTDSSTADVPTKVLSLHMLQFAYFVMYPWFLALNLGDRPKMARHILDQLTSAKQTLEEEDERSEVCLDFLHRYSYSNADPRPAPSFLAELALPEMEEGSAESRDVQVKLWSMGTSVIRIKTNRRSGWAQVDTLRPSGTTTMIVKVENIPIIDIGNEDADTKTSASVLLEGLPSRDKIELGHALGEPRTEESSIEPGELSRRIRHDEPASQPKAAADPSSYVWSGSAPSQRRKEVVIDPAYIAQQFFAYPAVEFADRPRLVKDSPSISRVKNLDAHFPVVDMHKIGVLYVGPGQTTQDEIMSNVDGSQNYTRFLHGLGRVVKLEGQRDIPTGLDTVSGENGKYTYAFWDDIHIASFHIATLMPNLPNEPDFANKVKCIGNDYVRIVFNDSGHDYKFDTISTAFQYCNIVISPHTTVASRTHDDPDEHNFFKVIVQRAEDVPEFGPVGQFKIISAASLPTFIRQLALIANLICKLFAEVRDGADNSTSWMMRLMRLKQIRQAAITRDARDAPLPEDPHDASVFTRDFTSNLG